MKSIAIPLLGAAALAFLAHAKSAENMPNMLFIWSENIGS